MKTSKILMSLVILGLIILLGNNFYIFQTPILTGDDMGTFHNLRFVNIIVSIFLIVLVTIREF